MAKEKRGRTSLACAAISALQSGEGIERSRTGSIGKELGSNIMA
jgi:hypothetical protein